MFVTSFLLLLVVWQVLVLALQPSPTVLPSPSAVAARIVEAPGLLWTHSLVTLREILSAFALACAAGLPLALALAFFRTFARLVYPIIIVSQAIPKIAIAPIVVAWFGFGATSNLVLAFLVSIFPIIINGVLGFTSIDEELVKLGRIMGASRWRLFRRIRLPHALPNIFAGFKLGITLATIGAIVGEFMAGSAGLGYLIQVASGSLAMDMAFAAIVTLAVLGVTLFYAVQGVERWALPWNRESG